MTNPNVLRRELTYEAPATHNVLDKEFVGALRPADPTPSVLNLTKFAAVNVAPVDVTYFDDGFDGQTIAILGDGQTTVKYNVTKLVTNTGADKLLQSLKVYRFTRYDKVWYEDA